MKKNLFYSYWRSKSNQLRVKKSTRLLGFRIAKAEMKSYKKNGY